MDITTSAPAPGTSEYLLEVARYGAAAIPSRAADHEARCLAHVIRRAEAPQRRLTLEEAIPELRELRELLEENLGALRSLYEEQRRALSRTLQELGAPTAELRALMQPSAPWVHALDQTRQMIRAQFLEIAAIHVRARAAAQK
jgi:hypothetical protein